MVLAQLQLMLMMLAVLRKYWHQYWSFLTIEIDQGCYNSYVRT